MKMSSFFIRPGKDKGKMKRKGRVYVDKNAKTRKRPKIPRKELSDEEISSDEDELINYKDVNVESDEETQMTAQEKKVKLAKAYLKDIEKEEKEKLETEELGNSVILDRLHDEVLSQAGKLRRKVADNLVTDYRTEEFHVLWCKEYKLSITCLVVSTDNILYTGAKDCTIVKWCLIYMKKLGVIPPRHKHRDNETLHASPVMSLAVSSDNKYLASCDNSNIIQIWDPKTLSHLFSFKGHTASVTGLSFCRFTQNLYSCSKDKTVKVWSVLERAYLETLFGHQMPITGLDVLSKDRAITSGGTDNSLRLWKIQEESQLIYNHTRSIDGVKRLDDNHFISYGDDGSICMWFATRKKPAHIIEKAHGLDPSCKEPRWICSVATLPNSDVFASGSYDGLVRLWKCDETYKKISLLATIPVVGYVNTMAFTPDNKKLVIGIGQEHRLGRWSKVKAKNSIVVVHIKKPD